MSTESSHPVSEDLSSTVMVLGNQLMSLIFIALIQIPHLGNCICEVHSNRGVVTSMMARLKQLRNNFSVTLQLLKC